MDIVHCLMQGVLAFITGSVTGPFPAQYRSITIRPLSATAISDRLALADAEIDLAKIREHQLDSIDAADLFFSAGREYQIVVACSR